MHSQGSSVWRGNAVPHQLRGAALVGEEHQIVAVGVGGEVAPCHLGDQELPGLGRGQLLAQRAIRTRSLNAGSSSPASGLNPHWLRNRAVSFR